MKKVLILTFAALWGGSAAYGQLVTGSNKLRSGSVVSCVAGIKMVYLEGSKFSSAKTAAYRDSTVADFYIGKYEVTQAQWKAVMTGYSGSWPTGAVTTNPLTPSQFVGDNRPVERVSWDDIQIFLVRLNEQSGRDDIEFRLPTEVEWEYAAMGGKLQEQHLYAGHNTLIDSVGWYTDNSAFTPGGSDKATHEVGQKWPNAMGTYDMSGNVWEWCSNCRTWNNEICSARALRGGSWYNAASRCTVSDLNSDTPGNRSSGIGFRLACSSKAVSQVP
jgi:formylglycine-generating enzyme required for sulfatase activity